jgi:hypothetical protein
MAKITAAQYNAVQSAVASVLGTGSGASGYGQSVASSQVAVGGTIRLSQFTNLRNDLIRIRNHNGVGITNGTSATGNPANSFNQLVGVTSTSVISDALRVQYTNMSTRIVTDRLVRPLEANLITSVINNTITVPAQFALTTLGSGVGSQSTSTTFNGTRTHTITVTGATTAPASGDQGGSVANSAANLRFFFNAGGSFRFSASRTGGSVNNKNTYWTALLNYGTIEFRGDTVTQAVAGLFAGTLTTGVNYRTLTTSPVEFFRINGSVVTGATNTPYQTNFVSMTAQKTADNSGITFVITYSDASTGGGGPFDEPIDGTWASTCQLLRPAGTIQQSGTNSVSVTAPTVTSTMP